jgi:hypothetical protein
MRNPFKRGILAAGALATLLGLSGCGTTPGQRFLSGAAIGAGTGAVAGLALNGLAPGTGALIGGLVGGGVGAMTTPHYSGRHHYR